MGKYYETDCLIPYLSGEDHYDYGIYKGLYEALQDLGDRGKKQMFLGDVTEHMNGRLGWEADDAAGCMVCAHFLEEGLFVRVREYGSHVIDIVKTLKKMAVEFPRTIVLE